jgi:hypothetical protein
MIFGVMLVVFEDPNHVIFLSPSGVATKALCSDAIEQIERSATLAADPGAGCVRLTLDCTDRCISRTRRFLPLLAQQAGSADAVRRRFPVAFAIRAINARDAGGYMTQARSVQLRFRHLPFAFPARLAVHEACVQLQCFHAFLDRSHDREDREPWL